MRYHILPYLRLLTGCLFLGIFVARFAVSFTDLRAKTQYAVTTEDNDESNKQGNEQKNDCKKLPLEYEHLASIFVEHLVITKRTGDIHSQSAAATQPWHLSVPTPPPNTAA